MARRSNPRTRVRARVQRLALSLIVAAAVLFGPLHAGNRYFYCQALGLLTYDPCALGAYDHSRCPQPSVGATHTDCCTRIVVPNLPRGIRAADHTIPPPDLVARVPVEAGDRVDVHPATWRAGDRVLRPPRPPRERRAQLMVFLS